MACKYKKDQTIQLYNRSQVSENGSKSSVPPLITKSLNCLRLEPIKIQSFVFFFSISDLAFGLETMASVRVLSTTKTILLVLVCLVFTFCVYWSNESILFTPPPLRVVARDCANDRQTMLSKESNVDYYEQFVVTCTKRGILNRLNNQNMTRASLSKIIDTKVTSSGKIVLRVQTYSITNVRKTQGGDVLVVWAVQPNGDGRVSGEVTDNQDGTYSGILNIPWSGKTTIQFKVASFFENTCIKFHAMKKYAMASFVLVAPGGILGTFSNGLVEDIVPCGPQNNVYNQSKLCNFTTINDGMSWYCGHPGKKGLTCKHISEFNGAPFGIKSDPLDKQLTPVSASLSDSVTINVTANYLPVSVECMKAAAEDSWRDSNGYHLNGRWHFLTCKSTFNPTVDNYKRCLKDRTLYFLGDSTVRQYGTYLLSQVMKSGANLMQMKGQQLVYHPNTTISKFNISVRFIKHAMPFHYPRLKPNQIRSLLTELRLLAQSNIPGERIIVMANIFAHFQAFRFNIFKDRIDHLAMGIAMLKSQKPKARVLIRGPHLYMGVDARTYMIYKEMTVDTFTRYHLIDKVIFLDVWSISIAYDKVKIHPEGDALEDQMTQFMSYIC